MNPDGTASTPLRHYTKLVTLFAILLIWWGAATTTTRSGMVFADWPLSLGSVNPPGWLSHLGPFLEHSHRLLATLVGLLVLALFSWVYARSPRRIAETVGLVALLAVIFGIFIVAGAERASAERKGELLSLGLGVSVLPVAWLAWSWFGRGWTLLQKLSALALLMVTAQAILGGLRVTEVSDGFAVIHGCLAQIFFCLLILICLVAGRRWDGARIEGPSAMLRSARVGGTALVGLISLQLILGAAMRHFHRYGLADTDLLKTQGAWIPSMDEPIIALMFLHKATAFGVLLFAVGLYLLLRGQSDDEGSRWFSHSSHGHLGVIVAMILAQIALGLVVIATGKQFWITNFHVLNGLAILAMVFVFVVKAWRGRESRVGPVAVG